MLTRQVFKGFNRLLLTRSSSNAAAAPEKPSARKMPPCDYVPPQHTGPTYEEALEIRKNMINPAKVPMYKKPLYITHGHMQWLFDNEKRRYLDFFAGIVTVSVGHCHPYVVEATEKQLRSLWHTTNIYLHPTMHEFAKLLLSKFPSSLSNVFFCNSGSEANDLALYMAREYTQRNDILTLRYSYHGTSTSVIGLTNISNWRPSQPIGQGVRAVMCPDPYKGHWGGKYCRDSEVQTTRDCNCSESQECEATMKYVQDFEDVLNTSCSKRGIAGFYAESVQGVGGVVQFPKNYLKYAFGLARERGGVCISDEVQTGFGRLGSHYWGFQTHGVVPDIVTMAKGIGNGFPLAAVVTTKEVATVMAPPQGPTHFNTFGGNPLACAAGKATLEVMDSENLQENARILGSYLIKRLEKLRDKYPEHIGDVRGKGLMLGIELTDPNTNHALTFEKTSQVVEACKENGLLIGRGGFRGNVLRLAPPMCISKADCDYAADVLDDAMKVIVK